MRRKAILPVVAFSFLLFYSFLFGKSLVAQMNSDDLYMVDLVRDLVSDPSRLKSWWLATCPSIFPDLIPGGAAFVLLEKASHAYIAYAMFVVFLLLGGVVWLCAMLGMDAYRSVLVGVCTLTFQVTHWIQNEYFNQVGLPAFHGGTLINMLGLICILFYGITRGFSTWTLCVLGILAFLSALSDILILPYAIVPITLLVLLFRKRSYFSKYPTILVFLWGGAGLGYVFLKLLLSVKAFHLPEVRLVALMGRVGNAPLALEAMGRDFKLFAQMSPGIVLMLVAASGIAVWLAVKCRLGRRVRADQSLEVGCLNEQRVLFVLLLLLVSAPTLLAPVVTFEWRNPWHVRHAFPLMFLPTMTVFLVLFSYAQTKRPSRWLTAASFVFLAWIFLLPWSAARIRELVHIPADLPRSEAMAYIDEVATLYGVTDGLAAYWNARNLRYHSRVGLNVRPLLENGFAMHWLNNRDRFLEKEDGSTPAYSFVISSDWLTEGAILARFGRPDRVIDLLEGNKMFLYLSQASRQRILRRIEQDIEYLHRLEQG